MMSRRRRSTQLDLLTCDQILLRVSFQHIKMNKLKLCKLMTKFLANELSTDFHTCINNLAFKTCDICNEKFPGLLLYNSTTQVVHWMSKDWVLNL